MANSGTLTNKIRPLKFALLVDGNDKEQLKKAIALCASLWGGAYCPILPLHSRKPAGWNRKHQQQISTNDVLMGYLQAFDPDLIINLASSLPEAVKAMGIEIISENQLWKSYHEDHLEIQYGLSVFPILSQLFDEHFKYKSKFPVRVVIPEIKGPLNLFWASVLGSYDARVSGVIGQHYKDNLEIETHSDSSSWYNLLLDQNVLFPRRITQQLLEQKRMGGYREKNYLLMIDGLKTGDLIDYWNLRATGRNVIVIPQQLFKDPSAQQAARTYIMQNFRPMNFEGDRYMETTVTASVHVNPAAAEQFLNQLELQKYVQLNGHQHITSLQHWFPRIWDDWGRAQDGITPDEFYYQRKEIPIDRIEGREVHMDALLPDFLKASFASNAVCANEISFRIYSSSQLTAEAFPKASGRNYLKALGSFAALRKKWRVGQNGLVHLVNYGRHESWKIPDPESVFFAWLRDLGYHPEPSVPGLVARRVYEILEGYLPMLKNEQLLKLLEHMAGGTVSLNKANIKAKKGEYIINRERELEYGELKSRLKTKMETDDLLGYLVEKKVFQVGLKVKCPHCFRETWYPMEKLQIALSCQLCLNHFEATGNVEKGKWCYKTTGPFSIPQYANGAYAVLLALRQLSSSELIHLETTPVLSFTAKTPDGKAIEADYAMFWQESTFSSSRSGLLFGESKTFNDFKANDFARMALLAKRFPGAILVFSTLRKQLDAREISALTKLAKQGRKYWKHEMPINPVMILTGNELLADSGIPFCWQEQGINVDKMNLNNLHDIAEATQEIYLKLPSLQQYWVEIAQKRKPKRA